MPLLKLLLILSQLGASLWDAHERRQFRGRIKAIQNDPVAEWNRRFNGVRMPLADFGTNAELPAAVAALAAGEHGRVVPIPAGLDPASIVFRAGGSVPTLKVVSVGPIGKVNPPMRKTPGAAGFDLYAARAGVIRPGEQIRVPTGYCVDIPEGYCGQVWPRSGLSFDQQIDRRAGLIDDDFRGELSVLLRNESSEPWVIGMNDRIAQLVLVPCLKAEVQVVEVLSGTERGAGGYGSTGVH